MAHVVSRSWPRRAERSGRGAIPSTAPRAHGGTGARGDPGHGWGLVVPRCCGDGERGLGACRRGSPPGRVLGLGGPQCPARSFGDTGTAVSPGDPRTRGEWLHRPHRPPAPPGPVFGGVRAGPALHTRVCPHCAPPSPQPSAAFCPGLTRDGEFVLRDYSSPASFLLGGPERPQRLGIPF